MIECLIYFIGVFSAYMIIWCIARQFNKDPNTMPHDTITKSALVTWIPAVSLMSWLIVFAILIYTCIYGIIEQIRKYIGEDWLNSEI